MVEFSLDGRSDIALHNLLKVEGLCESGAAAKHAISEGLVSVDGQIELRKRCKIKAGQWVEFAQQKVGVVP